VAELVVKGARIALAVEIAALPAPIGPGSGFSDFGTPALRKYFWASTSLATWLQLSGTSISSWAKTMEPSGLRISLVAVRKAMPS
jgi:hypothetical protein